MSKHVIAGIDEAGRGPLAGPVVAGICVLDIPLKEAKKGRWTPEGTTIVIGDSKALTDAEREEAYAWITTNCAWGMGMSDAQMIDTQGILTSTESAMHGALEQLEQLLTPTYLLVDGRDKFWFNYPHSSVIRGDSLEPAIAAASIIAKVTRDRLMIEAAKAHPLYGFEGHKGYASEMHIEAIKKHGPCVLHRKTFLRNIIPSFPATTTEQHLQGTKEPSAADPR